MRSFKKRLINYLVAEELKIVTIFVINSDLPVEEFIVLSLLCVSHSTSTAHTG